MSVIEPERAGPNSPERPGGASRLALEPAPARRTRAAPLGALVDLPHPADHDRLPRRETTDAADADVVERLAAVERGVGAVHDRLDAVATELTAAAAAILERVVAVEAAMTRAAPNAPTSVGRGAAGGATSAGAELAELRSDVRLVADRISTLLGGPSLTELMDRIDELDRSATEGSGRRRRRQPGR